MSRKIGAGASLNSLLSVNINDFVAARQAGVIKGPQTNGRRAKKRAMQKKMANASLLAPLLAAQGCLTLGKDDDILLADNVDDTPTPAQRGGGSAAPVPANGPSLNNTPIDADVALAAQADHLHTETGEAITIPASQLQANDVHDNSGPLEIVRVFDAVNGTLTFNGSIIEFVPDEGFEGSASFKYEARDASGAISEAIVEIHVGEMTEGGDQHDGEHGDAGRDDDNGADEGQVHPDDASKAGEHMALFGLVPVAEATHIAVNNGSWFDPNTWATGEVPPDGAKVLIPDGVTVDYDGESAVSLFTVRVDGALEFATDQDTFMEVDTLIVSASGELIIGTAENPVADGVEAVIQIADNGPIDVAWDPMLLSRGVVSHGTVEIHGAEKDTFLKVAIDAMAGDTSITLEAPPDGWAVGDRLVLTGTHLPEFDRVTFGETHDVTTEDEELIITAIDGNVISFDRALEFNHDTPRDDLKAYVANYTRNVRVITENADDLPVHQRGHAMFMHSDDIDVRYAEFTDLGRTDKSERAFDVGDLETVESDSNVKGRYSLHIHRAGVADQDDPAMLVGNAVWGSPGWGFVHHDSNAVLSDNAAYDVFGAAFVAETGNETGRWVHNIAIKSIGVGGFGDDNNPKVGADVEAFDLGRTGAGFWFQGRIVDAVDNVAASVPGGHGFVYFSRGSLEDVIGVNPLNAPQPESLNYVDEARIYQPAISQFVGNETLASGSGFYVVKPGPVQQHDVRSVINDFTAWETRFGVHLEYTANYTLKDIDLVGAANGISGISAGQNTFDLVVNNANIEGFDVGVDLAKSTNFPDHDGNFNYVFIDVSFADTVENFRNLDGRDQILTQADLTPGRLEFTSDIPEFSQFGTLEGEWSMNLPGTKIDSIGAIEVGSTINPQRYVWDSLYGAAEQEGYWTLPDGRVVIAFERYFADRATGTLTKEATFIEVPGGVDQLMKNTQTEPEYHGVLDLDSEAPVVGNDFATLSSGESITLDVLANDFDPDGDPIAVDGFIHPKHGSVRVNDDGTVTYTADPNYTGTDHLCYWVEDNNGNFTMGEVFVTVEV